TLVLLRTPDGHGRIELDKFHTPEAIRTGPENAPVNELGIRRLMFAVDNIDDVVARLLAHGAELVGEVVQYEDKYRLAYVRGLEGGVGVAGEEIVERQAALGLVRRALAQLGQPGAPLGLPAQPQQCQPLVILDQRQPPARRQAQHALKALAGRVRLPQLLERQ